MRLSFTPAAAVIGGREDTNTSTCTLHISKHKCGSSGSCKSQTNSALTVFDSVRSDVAHLFLLCATGENVKDHSLLEHLCPMQRKRTALHVEHCVKFAIILSLG